MCKTKRNLDIINRIFVLFVGPRTEWNCVKKLPYPFFFSCKNGKKEKTAEDGIEYGANGAATGGAGPSIECIFFLCPFLGASFLLSPLFSGSMGRRR